MPTSWDRTSVIFKVGVSNHANGLHTQEYGSPLQETFTSHRILAHPQGFVGQVAWSVDRRYLFCVSLKDLRRSPSGSLLLTKLGRGVKVWTEVCIPLPHGKFLPLYLSCYRMACAEKRSIAVEMSSLLHGSRVVKVSCPMQMLGGKC